MEEHKMNDGDEEMLSFSTTADKLSPSSSNKLGNSARSDNSRYSKVSRFSMGFIKDKAPTESENGPFYDVIHLLVIVLSDLSAGTMLLSDVLGINRKPSFEDFQLYLQTLEIYGTGYIEDIDLHKHKMRETQSHTEAAVY
jgi:hypothetical protein